MWEVVVGSSYLFKDNKVHYLFHKCVSCYICLLKTLVKVLLGIAKQQLPSFKRQSSSKYNQG